MPDIRLARLAAWATIAAGTGLPLPALAQAGDSTEWARCSAVTNNDARLACFDRWAAQQRPGPATAGATGASVAVNPAKLLESAPAEAAGATQASQVGIRPCASPRQTDLSRFWELEPGSDCGTFGIRGYRPLSLSWITADSVNTAPSSPTAGQASYTPYRASETRIQLSVRTKIARGLLTAGDAPGRDSLWFGYTQQSYWQLSNGALSRPFRSTDHEPELTYIYPSDAALPGGWRLRYSGIGAVHQSNGQSLPLSRGWNRVVLMTGMEHGDDFRVLARVWARVPERAGRDDNPGISNYVGRAEVVGVWNVNRSNTLGLTLRHSLRSAARGSLRLEWLTPLGKPQANGELNSLRLHTQLFSGYGDSLLDYNRRRTVLGIGLSLVDF